MSDTVQKKPTHKMDRFIMSITYDGEYRGSYVLEGIKDTKWTFERFLNWFLVMRSKWFELSPEEIEPIINSIEQLEVPQYSEAKEAFSVLVKDKALVAYFCPHKFGMW